MIEQLPVGWWGSGLPGVEAEGTYELLPPNRLPRINADSLQTWAWVPDVDAPLDWSISDPDEAEEVLLVAAATGVVVPVSFRSFVTTPRLRWAIRSVTGCWWSLGRGRGVVVREELNRALGDGEGTGTADSPIRFVPALGRHVLRFLTDQQDSLFWFLVLGDVDGTVIASDLDMVEASPETIDHIWKVAPTFEEFVYRFWIENEIAFRANEKAPLTNVQQAYLEEALRPARP